MALMLQLAKFAAVGILNTAINFGVLNLASLLTGITAGLAIGGLNIPATIVAAANSYAWNKLWVFKKEEPKKSWRDIIPFAVVTTVGALITSWVVFLLPRTSTRLRKSAAERG